MMSFNEKSEPYIDYLRRIWMPLKSTDLKSFESTESWLSSCAAIFEFERRFFKPIVWVHRFEERIWRSILQTKRHHIPFIMPKWNSKCSFVFVFFMKLNLPKSKFYIKFWENWSIMKMSYKVSLVRYRIPYPFENLTQRLVINNNSRSTSFNFRRLLNIENCTTPRRLALSNKIFI